MTQVKHYQAIIVDLASRNLTKLVMELPAESEAVIDKWSTGEDTDFLLLNMRGYFANRAPDADHTMLALMSAAAYKRAVPLAEQEQYGVVVL